MFLICIFLPFTYIAGILITELSILILTIYFLINNRNVKFFKNKLSAAFIIFSIFIAIVAIFKIGHFDLKISSIFYFRYILFALSIYYLFDLIENNLVNTKNFILIIFLLYLFIFFDSFFQFIVGKNLFGNEIINERVSSIFGEELILGSFLIKTLPIFLWLIIYLRFDIEKNKLFLIFFFSFFFNYNLSFRRKNFICTNDDFYFFDYFFCKVFKKNIFIFFNYTHFLYFTYIF